MAKRKSPQEMMAARNPLNRTAVAPVDIYSQPVEETVVEAPQEPKPQRSNEVGTVSKVKNVKRPKPQAPAETDSPYSTYLYRRQVKGIKLRAIEQGMKDKQIVQQAIDEFFEKHPL